MVRTWAHGNVIIFRTVSQGGTERGGGRAGIHGYIVILRAGTIGAGQWGFSSLKKKKEQSSLHSFQISGGNHCDTHHLFLCSLNRLVIVSLWLCELWGHYQEMVPFVSLWLTTDIINRVLLIALFKAKFLKIRHNKEISNLSNNEVKWPFKWHYFLRSINVIEAALPGKSWSHRLQTPLTDQSCWSRLASGDCWSQKKILKHRSGYEQEKKNKSAMWSGGGGRS